MDVKGHRIYEGTTPVESKKVLWIESSRDDLMIERLRELGAIVLGVTVMVEGGISPLGYNSHFQGPTNARSLHRYSGGSSSGSAAAVASGLVPVAIGFDGGGSIRVPSAMSGIHGLATTFGRIPFQNHTMSTMIKSGPMAATAEDAALTYAVIAQNDPTSFYGQLYDGGVNGPPVPHLTGFNDIEDLSDVRIGIFAEWFNDSEPQVRKRCHEVIDFLKQRGATVVPIRIPHLQWMILAHGTKIATEFAAGYDRIFHGERDSLEAATRVMVGIGSTTSALEVLAGEKLRAWAFQYVTNLFKSEGLHAIANPTIGIEVPILSDEAKVLGESDTVLVAKIVKFIFIGNFLGLPGLSVPVGFISPSVKYHRESDGVTLPVGFHLLGDHWTEHKLLRLGHAIEHGFTRKLQRENLIKPKFHFDPLN